MSFRTATLGQHVQIVNKRLDDALLFDQAIAAKCDNDKGYWYCLTHQEGFGNNIQLDTHTEEGRHLVTWVCFQHGPEVP